MTREKLIQSAETIGPFSETVAKEIYDKRERIVSEVNRIMLERDDLKRLIGDGNLEMMLNNHSNHGRFLVSLLVCFDTSVLVDTVTWVFRAYRSHGFKLTYWPTQLNVWIDVYKQELSPMAFDEVEPLYTWFLISQPFFVALSEEPDASEGFHGSTAE